MRQVIFESIRQSLVPEIVTLHEIAVNGHNDDLLLLSVSSSSSPDRQQQQQEIPNGVLIEEVPTSTVLTTSPSITSEVKSLTFCVLKLVL